MNVPSEDIKDLLEAESDLGLVFATNLFIGKEPTKPSNSVTLFDYTGEPPQLAMNNQGYEYPSLQIRVRNTDYVAGWGIIEAIKNRLHGANQEEWNGTLYTAIYCGSGPVLLDWDENSRARFVCNFKIQRRSII
jgi:hypothetical protein